MRVVRFFLHVLIACAAPLAAQSALGQTFSGFYAGATGLYEDYVATTNAADISLAEKTRDKRFVWGGYAGYNMRVGADFVVGLEAGLSLPKSEEEARKLLTQQIDKVTVTTDARVGLTAKLSGSAGVRFGYLVTPETMVYAIGGLAALREEASISATVTKPSGATKTAWSLTADHVGWTLGAGVERYIADKWTTRIEYVRSNFSDRAYSGPTTPLAVNASTRANSARASISYHF